MVRCDRSIMAATSATRPCSTAASAVSSATSVPPPMAMPTSAAASAGASLMPSPTLATTWPSGLHFAHERQLVLAAADPARTSMPEPGADGGGGAPVVAGEHDWRDAGRVERRQPGRRRRAARRAWRCAGEHAVGDSSTATVLPAAVQTLERVAFVRRRVCGAQPRRGGGAEEQVAAFDRPTTPCRGAPRRRRRRAGGVARLGGGARMAAASGWLDSRLPARRQARSTSCAAGRSKERMSVTWAALGERARLVEGDAW